MPLDPEELARSLRDLLGDLELRPDDLAARLQALLDAAEAVLRVDASGLMLSGADGRQRAVGASNPLGAALERGQEEIGAGPGIDSVRDGRPISVGDLRDGPWPGLVGAVGDGGPMAVLSVPVAVSGTAVGNLNLLLRRAHRWTPAEISAAQAYAGLVATTLLIAATVRRDDGLVEQVRDLLLALDS